MKQQESSADAAPRLGALPLDPIRLEQFLDLQRSLLAGSPPVTTLADGLAQRITVFLGLRGAAVGLVADDAYRLLAVYGLPPDYPRRHGEALRRTAGAPERPLLMRESDGLTTLVLPFRAADTIGGLHLVTLPEACLTDDDVNLARAIALVTGFALANARQHHRLAQVARLRSDALTTMAHDLRAPLNAILGYASLLAEEAFGALRPEQRAVCATLERQALELVDLLGATLDVARLEAGRLPVRLEEFSLAEVVIGLASGTFARPVQTGRLRILIPPDLPRLRSDRVKVKEILQNLVDNALKHGAGAPVEVEVALAADGERVRLTVRDHGAGIPADVLPHLFEPFRAAGDTGTGFGLYIVRRFVEALGGRVAARSHPGEGAAVTVELPLAAPARG